MAKHPEFLQQSITAIIMLDASVVLRVYQNSINQNTLFCNSHLLNVSENGSDCYQSAFLLSHFIICLINYYLKSTEYTKINILHVAAQVSMCGGNSACNESANSKLIAKERKLPWVISAESMSRICWYVTVAWTVQHHTCHHNCRGMERGAVPPPTCSDRLNHCQVWVLQTHLMSEVRTARSCFYGLVWFFGFFVWLVLVVVCFLLVVVGLVVVVVSHGLQISCWQALRYSTQFWGWL